MYNAQCVAKLFVGAKSRRLGRLGGPVVRPLLTKQDTSEHFQFVEIRFEMFSKLAESAQIHDGFL